MGDDYDDNDGSWVEISNSRHVNGVLKLSFRHINTISLATVTDSHNFWYICVCNTLTRGEMTMEATFNYILRNLKINRE